MSTFNTTKEIASADLCIGMYVSKLEVPWIATEFSLQGVLVRNRQDILKLSSYGKTLSIDQSKSLTSIQTGQLKSQVTQSRKLNRIGSSHHRKQAQLLWSDYGKRNYRTNSHIADEFVHAHSVLMQLTNVFDEVKLDLSKLDYAKTEEVKSLSNHIVSSLLNNPDALLWLTKVKLSSRSVFEHTIRAAIWATLLGRSMGLSCHLLYTLNLAVLLSGVGKSYLRKMVWNEYDSRSMQQNYALWSDISLEKLAHCENIGSRVINVLANMTERYNGSGYPNQKQSNEIPLLAQIASLAESFDLILQPINSLKRISFSLAISELYGLADTLFDSALIEEFVQATGLYPVGTPVLLSSGCFGVVVEQSKDRRIRATVVLTHNVKGSRLPKFKIARLGEGKFHNVIIMKEAENMLDELVKEDLKQINYLVKNYHGSFALRILYFFRRYSVSIFRQNNQQN